MQDDLKRKTAKAFAWSAMQSWSIKSCALLLFFVLARYLTPTELGTAQAVTVLLAFIAIVSDQGFHNALIQRAGLQPADVNLPFFVALTISLFASLFMFVQAPKLAVLLNTSSATDLIRVAAVIPPITATNGILTAMFRRDMNFKSIARASVLASVISSLISLALVLDGWGPIALVIQAGLSAIINSALLWKSTKWFPNRSINTTSTRELVKFSLASFSSQIVDFFSSRLIDLIILGKYGVASLGIYAVGAKLYLTLLELLANSVISVAMSSLSKLLNDKVRLARTYQRFLFLSACTTLPLFVGIASLAPEICFLIFGGQWTEAAAVTHWFCLLGAVQAVQFFNGATLDATGHPRYVLFINLAKLGIGTCVLALYPAESISQLSLAFVLAQICISPLSFGLAIWVTGTKFTTLMSQIWPGFMSAAIAYYATHQLRVNIPNLETWEKAIILSSTFATTSALMLFLFVGKKLHSEAQHIVLSLSSRKN